MKGCFEPMGRRAFLKTGASGGLIAAAFPLWELSARSLPDRFRIVADHRIPEVSHRELRRIVRRYGGEFGEVGKEL